MESCITIFHHCEDVYSVYLCRKWVTCCDSDPVNVETFEKMCEINLFRKMLKATK